MNWLLTVKVLVHPYQTSSKCASLCVYFFYLFNCDCSVELKLIKRLKSTLLSCNLKLQDRVKTHLETRIPTSSVLSVRNRQPTGSLSWKFKTTTTKDFLSRKSQRTIWVALADSIQKAQCQFTLLPSQVILLMQCYETHYWTHKTKEKSLLSVPPSGKIMGFLYFSSYDTCLNHF